MTTRKKARYITADQYQGPRAEINNEPSMTKPDESYTIPELMAKARGGFNVEQFVNVKHLDNSGEDETFDDIAFEPDLDLSDLSEIAENSRAIIEDARNRDVDTKRTKSTDAPKASDKEAKQQKSGDNTTQTEIVPNSASNDPAR